MPTTQDLESGKFVRQHKIWDGTNWDDGYIDSKRRFRVYRPDYPRAYAPRGYALRSHIVWWLANDEVHKGDLHHINGDTLDDRLENLKLMTNSDHQRHHKARPVECMCDYCGKAFNVPAWRIRQRKVKFCSQTCFHAAGGRWNARKNT